MSAHDNGGPAFPQSETLYEDGAKLVREAHGGMSLRAWLAGQALPGLIAGYATAYGSPTTYADEICREAVSFADGVILALAERAKAEGQS